MSCLFIDDFEPFIDTRRLDGYCHLDNLKVRFKKPMLLPETQDGRLQKLPIEVYHNCLRYLDIGTLTSMRTVSQYTRASINSLHAYKELYRFAPEALRAVLATGMAPHIPLLRLHHALTSMECYYCKHSESEESTFGNYLSLYECHRICAFCSRNSPVLKPAELTHLINLCSQRKSSLSAFSLASIPYLKTIPGSYSPTKADNSSHLPRTTLILAVSVPLDSSKTLVAKEARILSVRSSSDTTKIYHHPFVRSDDESDISPSIGYTSPESTRQVSFRYTTTMSLPCLTPSKKLENGILCTECNLRMRYLERNWTSEQRNRRMLGRDPVASTRRRGVINEARKAAAKFYVLDAEGLEARELSIQEHYRIEHSKGWDIFPREAEWRELHKGPALPLLTHKRFWQPPKVEEKVAKVTEV